MTRETKVGLVVAGSFLCLVCIVVASKMRHGDEPVYGAGEQQDGFVKLTQNPKPEVTKPREEAKKKPDKNAAIVITPHEPAKEPGTKPKSASSPPPLAVNQITPGKKTEAQIQDELRNALFPAVAMNAPPALPSPNPDTKQVPLAPLPLPVEPKGPGPVNIAQVNPSPSGVKVPAPNVPAPNLALPPPLPIEPGPVKPAVPVGVDPLTKPVPAPNPFTAAPPMPVAPAKKEDVLPALTFGQQPMPVAPLKKNDVLPALTFGQQGSKVNPGPLVPPLNNGAFGTPGSNPEPAKPVAVPVPVPIMAKDPLPTNPALKDSFPAGNDVAPLGPPPVIPKDTFKREFQPTPAPVVAFPNPAPTIPAPTNTPPNLTPSFPAQANTPPNPNPIIGSQQLPSTPPITMPPPNFGNPNPTSPSVAIGGNKSLPIVRSSDPDVVQALPGESDFTTLSKRLYGTDKYASALLVYNREHRLALKNGEALAANPPILNSGQQVLHPPVGILERDYAKWINNVQASPLVPVIGTAPSVNPLPKPAAVAPDITPLANTPIGSGRSYKVQTAGGERIRDIAQRVLGDANRWTEIYRLNPSIQPQFAIPAGTALKLP